MIGNLDYNYVARTDHNSPNMVFIHGAGGDKTQWNEQYNFFQKKGWGVVIPSLPSHGLSPPADSLSISYYVNSIYRTLNDLKVGSVNLIGHSMGGALVLQLALQFSNSTIDKLILIGTGAKLRVASAFLEAIEADFNHFLELLGKVAYHHNTDPQIKSENEKAQRRTGAKIFYQDFKICDHFDIRSELNKVKNPVLIIVGEDDKMTPVKYSEYLLENLENSQLEVIPEAGHFVFQEAPNQVNELIYNFLAK
jgi:pimeloyl-ACP methyl ester carboxylesterase